MKLTTIFATAATIFTAWKMLEAYDRYRRNQTSQDSPSAGIPTNVRPVYGIAVGEPTPQTEAAFNLQQAVYKPAYREEEYIGIDPDQLFLEEGAKQ